MARRPRSREVAKQETREALLLAGLAEFAAHGLDAPSLDAICARAGYTRGAFYVHFRDRDEFLVAVMDRILGSFVDAMLATDGDEHDLEHAVDRYAGAAAGLTASARRSLPVHRLLDACARSRPLRERFRTLVREAIERLAKATERGQAAGAVRPDVDAESAATLLVAAAIGLATTIEVGVPLDLDALRRTALRLLSG
jgi:AcrR family transcriptional regulator